MANKAKPKAVPVEMWLAPGGERTLLLSDTEPVQCQDDPEIYRPQSSRLKYYIYEQLIRHIGEHLLRIRKPRRVRITIEEIE